VHSKVGNRDGVVGVLLLVVTKMQHTTSQPEAREETEQWEWVPAATDSNRSRAGGAVVLATSCLTIGILIGALWGPGLQKLTITAARTASDTPQSSLRGRTQEPTLALEGPSHTLPNSQEAEPKPTILNERSAKVEIDERSPLGQTRGTELAAEPRDVNLPSSNVANPRAEPKRRASPWHEPVRERDLSAKPAQKQTAERTFKDYTDLRKYALGK